MSIRRNLSADFVTGAKPRVGCIFRLERRGGV
jgi:hypothetical protein